MKSIEEEIRSVIKEKGVSLYRIAKDLGSHGKVFTGLCSMGLIQNGTGSKAFWIISIMNLYLDPKERR